MSSIPDAYLKIITPLIQFARELLEKGERLAPIAFVGNFETGITEPILLQIDSEMSKDKAANSIKLAAEYHQADFVFMLMEAWSLRKDKMHRMNEIYERYGSIGASPYAVDIVSMSLETRHGVWLAEASIKPKGVSKKKRTIGTPEFQLFKEAQGRFVHLLPVKNDDATDRSLH